MAVKLKVGDKVRLNDWGLEQVFGSPIGLSHMKTLVMTVTKAKKIPVFNINGEQVQDIEVDNKEITQFMIDNECFDLVGASA